MGGRYYDPELGRFLSADPFIQEPANAQSLNRYSYVLNNPLSYTDPSGFFFSKLFKAIGKAIKAVVSFIKDNIRTILAIAIMAIPGGNIIGSMALGFAAGMVASGGDLRAGIIGAITAGAFHGIGSYFQGLSTRVVETGYAFGEAFQKTVNVGLSFGQQVAKTIAHGVVGGLSQVASGGKFVAGFLSAGTSQAFALSGGYDAIGVSSNPSGFGGYVHNAVASAVVGGTASVLGGGKFKNGAITGAFSRMFNDVMSHNYTKGNVHITKSRLENVYSAEEWQVSGAYGDIAAYFMQRSPVPILQAIGYTLDAMDILNVQSRIVTTGQNRIIEYYSYDTLYNTNGYPSDSSQWTEVPGFLSGGTFANSQTEVIWSNPKTEFRFCLILNSGCSK